MARTALAPADEEPLEQFLARLGHPKLGSAEHEALSRAVVGSRTYGADDTIVQEGEHPHHLHLLLQGWAFRCRELGDGSRQITDLIVPGDLCDLSALGSGPMDQVVAITHCRVALLSRSRMLTAMAEHPHLAAAIFALALNEQAVLRTWLTCLGQQDRTEHLAHLICELQHRLKRIGLVGDHSFALPLTQEELADTLGMTSVHTNRILQHLRKQGFIKLSSRHMEIVDPAKLREMAEFNPAYMAV